MTSDNAIPIQTDIPGTARDVTRLYFDGGSAFGRPHARPSTAVASGRTWDDDQLLDAAHVGADGRDLHSDVLAALCRRYVDLAQGDNVRALELQAATVRVQDAERRTQGAAAVRRLAEQQLAAAQGIAAALQRELLACQLALDEERNAHQGTMFAREFAEDLHVAELAERNRVAGLHAEASARAAQLVHQLAQVSAENVQLRHQIAGTTPVGIEIALDRAARAVTGLGATELAVELERQVRQHPDERFDRSEPDAADTVVMAVEDLSAEEIWMLGAEVFRG
jgi:hypothetical protein